MGRKIQENTKYPIGYTNDSGWSIIDTFRKNGRIYHKLLCGCGCGEIQEVRFDNIDRQRMCKYQKSLIPPKHMKRDLYKTRLVGEQFGLLKVIEFAGYNKNKQILYLCECQCDNKTLLKVTYSNLISGKKDHCGCLTHKRISESHIKGNKYDLSGKYGVGWTSNTNKEFYFDLEDYDKIKSFTWFEHKDNIDDKCGYIEANGQNKFNKRSIKLHRLVMGIDDFDIKIDHIKHKLNDNRKSQLRISTNQENTMNHVIHSNNSTGVSGVTYDKDKALYRVRIYYKYKTIHMGYFSSLEEAEKTRKEAEEKYFGEWSYDNSINYTGGNNEN